MPIQRPGFPFVFDPSACTACGGLCCAGESGDIYLNRRESAAIAEFLGIPPEAFRQKYTKKVRYKTSLTEIRIDEKTFHCVFLTKTGCAIYPVRPNQCRTYPFWCRYKSDPAPLAEDCPGIRLLSENRR